MRRLTCTELHVRPLGQTLEPPRIDPNNEHAIRAALAAGGQGMLEFAAEFGFGLGNVQRIKAGG